MDLVEIRVRNFRSVETEQHLKIPGSMTIVGPNNTGKTNLLKALQVLFTGYDNSYGYAREGDLTFGAGRARTSITATFDGDEEIDGDTYDSLDELHSLQGTERKGTQVSLSLYFTETNTPVYGFFPNVKRPEGTQAAQYSRIHKTLVNSLLDSFSLHYVPSAKSVDQIFDELITPFLRRKISKVMEPHITDINEGLSEAARALNAELVAAGLSDFEASFSLPGQSIEELLSGFDFMVSDPQETPIHEKGMGIQTTALLAAFRWITKQEMGMGRKALWLLEEPESYLHPDLANNCNTILDNLANDAIVVKTTHSMAFVPQHPEHVCGTSLNKRNRTEILEYKSFSEAVSSIRSALGVKFSDFYNLAKFNVLVEGKSDREIFQWFLEEVPVDLHAWTNLRNSRFEDFGGVRNLEGFLRATYQFIRAERSCVAVFDGDQAGAKAVRDLQAFFGRVDISFQSNLHFVSVRSGFAIEGLFPDDWMMDLNRNHPNWFDAFSFDASGQIQSYDIKDSRKQNVQNSLITRAKMEAGYEWSERFCEVCSVIDTALGVLSDNLE